MRPLHLALALAPLAACTHSHEHHENGSGTGIPVFAELERNDDPLTANHFGVLRPGDHFFIDGFVRDDAIDPFDGFAFTAGGPLHVDFQLFIGNAAADLDVCLYDPQLDETLACFATAEDPERGGVDVTAGGLDFHLVIESFVGDASYSLEIDVQPLFFGLTAADSNQARSSISAVDARVEHALDPGRVYRKPLELSRPVAQLDEELWIDERSGLALAIVHVHR
jgi:hypothetical protein